MEQLLNGKVALVTGGGSGIGEATAKIYAQYGAKVVVSDIDERKGTRVAYDITGEGGEAIFVHADVSVPGDCERLVKAAVYKYGRLDIACNNAGIGGDQAPLADMSIENWRRVLAVNLDSIFYCMRYQVPAMLENGGGAIVNMASILGAVGFAGASAYVASKHGMVGLTRAAALDYSAKGIRVNAIGPAFIDTPLLSGLDEHLMGMLTTLHPIGRIGKPEEVGEFVAWLSSDKASFVTGNYYPVDGGYLSQ